MVDHPKETKHKLTVTTALNQHLIPPLPKPDVCTQETLNLSISHHQILFRRQNKKREERKSTQREKRPAIKVRRRRRKAE